MRRSALSFIALAFALAAQAGGQVRLDLGANCAGDQSQERACLEIEFLLAHLLDLRDEITGGLEAAGGGACERGLSCNAVLVCDQCSVDKGIAGCTKPGDRTVVDRWGLTAHRIACYLTAIRGQKLERDAKALVAARLNRAADIGLGMPRVADRRPPVEIRVDYNIDGSEQQ